MRKFFKSDLTQKKLKNKHIITQILNIKQKRKGEKEDKVPLLRSSTLLAEKGTEES